MTIRLYVEKRITKLVADGNDVILQNVELVPVGTAYTDARKIYSRNITDSIPNDGDVLTWDTTTNSWVYLAGGSGSGDAVSIQGIPVSTTDPLDAEFLVYDDNLGEWVPYAITSYVDPLIALGVSDHEASLDPHAIYLKEAEADLLYADIVHAHSAADITSGTLPITRGGTDATDAATARTNLGLGDLAVINSPLPLANGGTGATTAATARTALGLGNISVVNIPLGVIQGGTGSASASGARTNLGLGSAALLNSPIPLTDGGTGAITAADARTNLGLGTLAVENIPVTVIHGGTGATDAATARTNLGLGSAAVLNTPIPVADGGTGGITASAARTNLGLGTMAVVNSPVPVANGGTAATDAATALTNLGAASASTLSAHVASQAVHGVNITAAKTLSVSNSMTLVGLSDGFTITFPASGTPIWPDSNNPAGLGVNIAPTAQFEVQSNATTRKTAVIRAATSQTVNVLEVYDDGGVLCVQVDRNGKLFAQDAFQAKAINTDSNPVIQTSTGSTGNVIVSARSTTHVPLTVRGIASQTGDLFQAQNSSNTVLFGVTITGANKFIEQSDPTAPSTNEALLYAKDNGSGKTQLAVRFATGAVQILATEP